jgi:hypothetical protein
MRDDSRQGIRRRRPVISKRIPIVEPDRCEIPVKVRQEIFFIISKCGYRKTKRALRKQSAEFIGRIPEKIIGIGELPVVQVIRSVIETQFELLDIFITAVVSKPDVRAGGESILVGGRTKSACADQHTQKQKYQDTAA